ncbi:GNAT family N-acetyltransferase [Myceligenerans sp. TRM 65318]|uniref:GNAT family N-acetyltransferase n=2 Tax=Myceligenerans pegani TaxID=2776917 RepID=A0ABR9MVP3_9MICO|nr:GNAT family N-acetyltransferase [Myceligenerans sp. TRM 65318]MBE3017734.1 GNAT family N-acetyltransferase [Myceligenerans sp. TRM 65318]
MATFGLSVRWDDLELRLPDDAELLDLADVAADGVHAPEAAPFSVQWTRGTADEVRRQVLTHHWRVRQRLDPDDWGLELGVYVGGRIVGAQGIGAKGFPVTRAAHTGSWLGMAHQGRGIGTRMRLAVLHLAFDGLGAAEVASEAFVDNPASNAVSRRLGYELNGVYPAVRDGKPAHEYRYRMTREAWDRRPGELRPAIEIEGADPVRDLLGITTAEPPSAA